MSQMGFNIDYIKAFPETAERIRKNLKVNYEYRFEEALPTGFFARNISVHAIVGKNGSGKSTLLEILYRLVNNLSFVLLKDIPRNAADKPIYIFVLPLIGTCKNAGIEPRVWMEDVLKQIPYYLRDGRDLEELLPGAWAARNQL